jgi:hypothetical protein
LEPFVKVIAICNLALPSFRGHFPWEVTRKGEGKTTTRGNLEEQPSLEAIRKRDSSWQSRSVAFATFEEANSGIHTYPEASQSVKIIDLQS